MKFPALVVFVVFVIAKVIGFTIATVPWIPAIIVVEVVFEHSETLCNFSSEVYDYYVSKVKSL